MVCRAGMIGLRRGNSMLRAGAGLVELHRVTAVLKSWKCVAGTSRVQADIGDSPHCDGTTVLELKAFRGHSPPRFTYPFRFSCGSFPRCGVSPSSVWRWLSAAAATKPGGTRRSPAGTNPNKPAGDSENLLRVRGQEPVVERLTTEPGDIWPGPLPPAPTMKDLVSTGGLTPEPEQPVPGSPLSRGTAPPSPSPNPSARQFDAAGQRPAGLLPPQPAPPLSSYAAPPVAPPARSPTGQIIQTPSGPAVTTGGGPAYQTTTTPGGGNRSSCRTATAPAR